jgi:phage terminase Nu1 subunit (DNA packaging protein)
MTTKEKGESAGILAEWLDCDEATVRNYAKAGHVKRLSRGLYSLKESVVGVVRHLRGTAAGRGGADGVASLTAARTRLATEQADAVAIKNAVLRGEYLRAADVTMRWDTAASTIQIRVMACVTEIAQALNLTRHQTETVDRILRDALNAAADEIDSLGDIGPKDDNKE